MDTDERFLRLELRQDQLERDISLARKEIAEGRRVVEGMNEHILAIRETLATHVIQEGRDRVKLFVSISGGLVIGIASLVMFVFQILHLAPKG